MSVPDVPSVRTFGLTHIALAVRDVGRSAQFYQRVDPDGYELEIWFEIRTPVDPEAPLKTSSAPSSGEPRPA